MGSKEVPGASIGTNGTPDASIVNTSVSLAPGAQVAKPTGAARRLRRRWPSVAEETQATRFKKKAAEHTELSPLKFDSTPMLHTGCEDAVIMI